MPESKQPVNGSGYIQAYLIRWNAIFVPQKRGGERDELNYFEKGKTYLTLHWNKLNNKPPEKTTWFTRELNIGLELHRPLMPLLLMPLVLALVFPYTWRFCNMKCTLQNENGLALSKMKLQARGVLEIVMKWEPISDHYWLNWLKSGTIRGSTWWIQVFNIKWFI